LNEAPSPRATARRGEPCFVPTAAVSTHAVAFGSPLNVAVARLLLFNPQFEIRNPQFVRRRSGDG
jgi:hypothetical protein